MPTLPSANWDHPSFFIAVFLIVGAIVWALSPGTSSLGQLPVPSGAEWIWGHEKSVFVNEAGRAFNQWINAVGAVFRIKAAFRARDVLVLCDPGGISYILQKKIYDYHHSKVVRPRVARLLGRGLGWVEGEQEHKRMRHLVSPSLSSESIRRMAPDVLEAAVAVINDLTHHVQLQEPGASVNILDWTGKATLNVIGRAAFSHDFEGGNSEEAQQIIQARRKGVSPIAKYAGFITLMMLRRFTSLNDLPIPAIQAQSIVKLVIHQGVAREMLQRNKELQRKDHKNDLLTRLLTAHAEDRLSREELLEQESTRCPVISTFVVSGHETTTQTLGFTVWELARHPHVQQRLREEIETFHGEPTYEDYQFRLPYLEAVLRETLRLYPGLPYMERTATKADVIPLRHPVQLPNGKVLNQIPINPGQTVIIPIISIHRMMSVWGDGDVFRPDRWLETLPLQDQLCSGWASTLAFSDGPRNCVGFRLAIFQYKVILTNMIRRFVFKDTGAPITLKISSSLQPWVIEEMAKGPQLPVTLELI